MIKGTNKATRKKQFKFIGGPFNSHKTYLTEPLTVTFCVGGWKPGRYRGTNMDSSCLYWEEFKDNMEYPEP